MRKKFIFLLSIFYITCAMHAYSQGFDVKIQHVRCADEDNGEITLTQPKPSFYKNLHYYDSAICNECLIKKLPDFNDFVVLKNLKAGVYVFTYMDGTGEEKQQSITIESPEELEPGNISVEKELSDYNSSDATLKANPKGGTNPYHYTWYKNIKKSWIDLENHQQILENTQRGWYQVDILDKNDCSARARILFEHGFSNGVPAP